MTAGEMLWWLLVGHAVMDYWAQSDALAKMKNRHRDPAAFCPPGQKPQAMWFYALTAHAMMHGAAVAFVTDDLGLGLLETFAHWTIDFGKCDNWYGIHVDQALHVACKLAWLWLAGLSAS
jgi:hypothetical protein